jgi:hypothetical protein
MAWQDDASLLRSQAAKAKCVGKDDVVDFNSRRYANGPRNTPTDDFIFAWAA